MKLQESAADIDFKKNFPSAVFVEKNTICFVTFSHGPDDSRILLSFQLTC